MRVAVVVEQTWDPESIEFDAATGEIDWTRAVSQPGPGSLDAVEVGLGLGSGETVAYAIGDGRCEGLLRRCVAMGARVARAPSTEALAAALSADGFPLVLTPARSGDESPNPVGPLLAGLLDLPAVAGVESLEVEDSGEAAAVRRRLDRGAREELWVPLPAVLALEPGLAAPRPASPAAVLAAQRAEVPVLEEAEEQLRLPELLGHRPPRPAPPRVRPPDPSLPAAARIAAVVGTGDAGRHRELARGEPEEMAKRIVAFLVERGQLEG
jgi:electron transfer flavoprotein alpha/beta subunit